jgi:hypothetical protein
MAARAPAKSDDRTSMHLDRPPARSTPPPTGLTKDQTSDFPTPAGQITQVIMASDRLNGWQARGFEVECKAVCRTRVTV